MTWEDKGCSSNFCGILRVKFFAMNDAFDASSLQKGFTLLYIFAGLCTMFSVTLLVTSLIQIFTPQTSVNFNSSERFSS